MKKIVDVVRNYEIRGYSCMSRSADLTKFVMIHDTYSHILTIIEKNSDILVQVSVEINKFMGDVKSWEFNYPNPNIERAIAQILEIRRSIQL